MLSWWSIIVINLCWNVEIVESERDVLMSLVDPAIYIHVTMIAIIFVPKGYLCHMMVGGVYHNIDALDLIPHSVSSEKIFKSNHYWFTLLSESDLVWGWDDDSGAGWEVRGESRLFVIIFIKLFLIRVNCFNTNCLPVIFIFLSTVAAAPPCFSPNPSVLRQWSTMAIKSHLSVSILKYHCIVQPSSSRFLFSITKYSSRF